MNNYTSIIISFIIMVYRRDTAWSQKAPKHNPYPKIFIDTQLYIMVGLCDLKKIDLLLARRCQSHCDVKGQYAGRKTGISIANL